MIILDSCFSGGMTAKSLNRKGARSRYYPRSDGSRSAIALNRKGASGSVPNGDAAVLYYTASQGDEAAQEMDFDGKAHGLFTYYLTKSLDGKHDLLWGDIHKRIKYEVSRQQADQHPELGPGAIFELARIFETKPEPRQVTEEDAHLWDIYYSDSTDPAKILFSIQPNKLRYTLREPVKAHVRTGVPGYLVILDCDNTGLLRVFFPHAREGGGFDVEEAYRPAGQYVFPEGDKVAEFDVEGPDHVKAILLTSRKMAENLLKQFRDNDSGFPLSSLQRQPVPANRKAPFYTHDITYEVIP
jgi:hypothetical protein